MHSPNHKLIFLIFKRDAKVSSRGANKKYYSRSLLSGHFSSAVCAGLEESKTVYTEQFQQSAEFVLHIFAMRLWRGTVKEMCYS